MNTQLLTILAAILGSSVVGVVVTNFFNRRKTKAEERNLTITGETQLSDGWKKYADQMRSDKDEIVAKFEILKKDFDRIIKEKDAEILKLQDRVLGLEGELKKYQNVNVAVIDAAKDNIHASVEIAAEQIKKDIHLDQPSV